MRVTYSSGTIDEIKATDSTIHIEMLQKNLYRVRIVGNQDLSLIHI